jgi:hypothetical protein
MRRLLAVSLLALALPVAAQAASNPIVAAAKRSASAKSSTFQIHATTALGGSAASDLTGSGSQRGSAVRMSMTTRAGGSATSFDAVLLRERGAFVMYMRSPVLQTQLPAGKSWWRLDLSKGAATMGVDFTTLIDASQSLAPLEHGIVATKRLGNETVAGRPTVHYSAVLDVHRAARAVPAYGKQVAALERATGVRLTRSAYHVWIGRDGRIRRMRVSTPALVGGARGTTVQTMTFLSYNVPVTIAAPPAAQVVEAG